MGRLFKAMVALLLPIALASCVLAPGKFVSTLKVDADRHFAFSYVGEVYAIDVGDYMMKGVGDTPADKTDPSSDDGDDSPTLRPAALQKGDKDDPAAKKAATDARNREIAAALSKEAEPPPPPPPNTSTQAHSPQDGGVMLPVPEV